MRISSRTAALAALAAAALALGGCYAKDDSEPRDGERPGAASARAVSDKNAPRIAAHDAKVNFPSPTAMQIINHMNFELVLGAGDKLTAPEVDHQSDRRK